MTPTVRPAVRGGVTRRPPRATRPVRFWAVLALALAAAACGGDGGGGDSVGLASRPPTSPTTAGAAAHPVPAAAPGEVADHPDDWVLPGRDYDNSRAAAGSALDSTTVDRVTVAWETELDGGLSTVPLVAGDAVYVQDGTGRVSAFDRATGEVRWQSRPYGANIGPFGAAVADGRVFGLRGATGIVALDAATGGELWARDITATPTAGVDIQPVSVAGLVLASTVPISLGGIYAPDDRGVIHALDAATGETAWTFDTVADPDLWGDPGVNSGGGAWYPPAVDPDRGLVYWGIANPAPFPGTAAHPNGTSRPGDNLYTDSAVALDLGTGELRWHHQVHAHDLFDRDLVHTMIARPPGGPVVVATGKGGVVVGLDPATGERRWATPVGVHRNDHLTALDGPTEVAPGTYGGVLTPPATADGIAYVATINAPTTLSPGEPAHVGAELGVADGQVVAVDTADGEVVWDRAVRGDPLGGVTVVNDLAITALFDGTVLALDRDTGAEVWRWQAPGGINGWPAVAGDLLVVPVGLGDPPRLVALRLPPSGGSSIAVN